MMTWPNNDQYTWVSTKTSPVTVEAETAVKKATCKLAPGPSATAQGT